MAPTLRTVAVLGAGTMGHGIAQVAAQAGCDVWLYDLEDEFVRRGLDDIRAFLDKGVAKGKVEPSARDETLKRITGTSDFRSAVADAHIVIEAVPEVLALKRDTFAHVVAVAPATCLLASNTSSLSIAAIAEGVDAAARGRVIGTHFFNPVPLMALLEIVVGPETAPTTVEAVTAFAVAIGKTPIVVQDVPGFASSRLGVVLGLEAMRIARDVSQQIEVELAL